MANAVTVFVDDAVLGRLPPICVKDGVFTGDRVVQRVQIGDAGLGIAWLLIFLGPIGWIVLIGMSLTQRPSEVLEVRLPLSEAAYLREGRARRAYRRAFGLAALGGVGLLTSILRSWGGSPALGLLAATAAGSVLLAGLLGMVMAQRRLTAATVELDLDASRRWVTICRVHPDFARPAARQALSPQEM